MLVEHTLFGTIDKVADSIKLLRDNEPPDGYYVCFSGGKDSCVMYDIVKRARVKYDAHINITGVEPPGLLKFVRQNYPEIEFSYPPKTMFELIVQNKIPPLRQIRYCCNRLKERGGKNRVKVTGVRSEESPRRAKRPAVEISANIGFVHAIKEFSTPDIWAYIRENNLPYFKLYDEGFSRVGCVLCPFESVPATKRDLERFPALVNYYRQACRRSFEVNHESLIKRFSSGDDMFDWWVSCRKRSYIAESCDAVPLFSEDDGSVL